MQMVKEDVYLSQFAEAERTRGNEPLAIRQLRNKAMVRFSELGFPTIKQEAWRFTNVAPVARTRFNLASPEVNVTRSAIDSLEFAVLGCPRLVFVDGFYRSELSDPPARNGLAITSLRDALQKGVPLVEEHLATLVGFQDHPFAALNTAFATDGAVIEVADDAVIDRPLHILHVSSSGAEPKRIHPRNIIVAGRSSKFALVESYLSLGGDTYLMNPVTEVFVGDNARVDHYRLQRDSRQAFHFGINQVSQGRDSYYRTTAIDLGAWITRNDLHCVLNGEGGLAALNGLYLLNEKQHVDNFTTLEHAKPHCDSRELFKGILDHQAKGVFRGRIIVHKDAQKTDSKQTNQNLLLSDDALVNTKPQLEIYADDVKCTHGATIGQLDATSMFYLRSRGIPEKAARSLLIYAFASELIDHIEVDELRGPLVEYLTQWLPKGDLVKEVYQG